MNVLQVAFDHLGHQDNLFGTRASKSNVSRISVLFFPVGIVTPKPGELDNIEWPLAWGTPENALITYQSAFSSVGDSGKIHQSLRSPFILSLYAMAHLFLFASWHSRAVEFSSCCPFWEFWLLSLLDHSALLCVVCPRLYCRSPFGTKIYAKHCWHFDAGSIPVCSIADRTFSTVDT